MKEREKVCNEHISTCENVVRAMEAGKNKAECDACVKACQKCATECNKSEMDACKKCAKDYLACEKLCSGM